ncbi:MAG: hypothetical protein ACAH59_07630 [Pseudobdellovibrionaceae bacterium]
MSSKLVATGASVLLSFVILLTGCDRLLKGRSEDENKKNGQIEISMGDVQCLHQMPTELQKFFDDEGSDENVQKSIECIRTSLKSFLRLTKGNQPDAYMAPEVQYFFNTFLLKENKISDEFLKEIMKFKVAVVGGSSDVVTRLEFDQFLQFLGDLQNQLLKIRGKMKIIFFRGQRGNVSPEDILSAKENLQSIADFVLKKSKITSSQYQWTDFKAFLEQLDLFLVESKGLHQLLQWMPLADQAKLLFLGSSAKLGSENDWLAAQKWMLNTYANTLRFYYRFLGSSLESPEEWNELLGWLDELFVSIEQAPMMREKKILEGDSIDQLINEVFKLNLFQTVLNPGLIQKTYRKVLLHFIVAPSGHGDESSITNLTDSHLRILKQEYNVWKLSQKFFIDTYSKHKATPTLAQLRSAVSNYPVQGKVAVSPLEEDEIKRSWLDFQTLLKAQPGITYSENLKVRINYGNENEALPFVGANMINAVRTMVRLAHRGYGDSQAKFAFDKKISRQRLIDLVEDFRDLGLALSFLDPREANSASRTFDQGNYFAFHGNGDEALNSLETYELLSVLISGGRAQLTELHQDLKQRGCWLDEKDVFNRNFVSEECFERALRQNMDQYLSHVPGMLKFLKSLSKEKYVETYRALMSIAYTKQHRAGILDTAELRTLGVVLSFIESLMVVYDLDRNLMMSEREVEASFPRFESCIVRMSPMGDFLAEDIFMYLVFNGRKPGLKDAFDLTGFVTKRHTIGLSDVGKYNLMQVLSILNHEFK